MTALLTACSALAVGLVGVAQGGHQDQYPPDGHKVTICHGTSSNTNPYVLITVDEEALGGHWGADGPGGEPGHGDNSNADVLPNADGTCPGEDEPDG
jgi:hypothetical protein